MPRPEIPPPTSPRSPVPNSKPDRICEANIENKNHKGGTPLHHACGNENHAAALAIAKATRCEHPANTPRARTCSPHINPVVNFQALIQAGASLDTKTNDGGTVMHFAARSGNLNLVRFLHTTSIIQSLKAGGTCREATASVAEALLCARAHNGSTPLVVAQRNERSRVVEGGDKTYNKTNEDF